MKIKVKDNQSLLDVAVQTTGSVESAFEIAVKSDVSVTGSLNAGQSLDKAGIVNNQVANQFAVKELVPATASTKVIGEQLTGIGYMTIGENFTVK